MNFISRLRLSAVLAGVSLLVACATSPMSRIDANRAAYESWPLEVQEAILNGQVKPGMTPEMVEMSVGKPTEVVNRAVSAGQDEVWIYRKRGSSSLLKNTSVSVGGGLGGVSVGTGVGGGRGSTEEDHEVAFQNGVVVRTDF
jgi:hypothetical protein